MERFNTAVPCLDEDDAALIDSFFLPGGILDPDEEDKKTTNDMSQFPSLHSAGFNRIPSNPWRNETYLGAAQGVPTLQSGLDRETTEYTTIPPPPGFSSGVENRAFFGLEKDSNLQSARIVRSEASVMMHDSPISNSEFHSRQLQQQLHPLSAGPMEVCPVSCIQDRIIRRPDPARRQAHAEVSSDAMVTDATDPEHTFGTRLYDTAVRSGTKIPPHINTARLETTNSFMVFAEHDDSLSANSPLPSPNAKGLLSSIKAATKIGETDSVEFDLQADDENEHVDDEEVDDIDDSTCDESTFPIEYLSFVKKSPRQDSLTSSVSSSDDDSEPEISRRNSYYNEEEEEERNGVDARYLDEGTLVQNSEVAVVVDIIDGASAGPRTAATESTGDDLVGVSCKGPGSKMRDAPYDAKPPSPVNTAMSAVPSTRTSQNDPSSQIGMSTIYIRERFDALKFSLTTIFPILDGHYVEWMQDLGEVLGTLTSPAWNLLEHILKILIKVLTIAGLLLFQLWKFALVEMIEEPTVTSCYVVFYFLPHCCSLIMTTLIVPHWTPNFVASTAVWLMCTTSSGGVLHPDTIELRNMPALIWERDGNINMALCRRPRDDLACQTILRILRYLLIVSLLVDGFSSEFGAILGVSGPSRLTAAFMMSLVRKSLISSPIGWVSWAVQVLFVTYHPASLFVDLFVLISGLSSIRLIRYLEARCLVEGNQEKSQDKHTSRASR
jgi:hypothetical protein